MQTSTQGEGHQGGSDPQSEHSEGGPWEALILVLINARFLCYVTLSVTALILELKNPTLGTKRMNEDAILLPRHIFVDVSRRPLALFTSVIAMASKLPSPLTRCL